MYLKLTLLLVRVVIRWKQDVTISMSDSVLPKNFLLCISNNYFTYKNWIHTFYGI